MLRLWKPKSAPLGHEEMFVARYEGLLAAALQLTDHDRARAEDLLHETFIEFTLSQPDLAAIENPDGYLRGVLRNIHLSEFRKSTRQSLRAISIAEYDSISLGLRQLDPTARAQAQDDLRAICQYACLRKASSKAGSVFILRFFHGYFPGEIARLCHSSAPGVSELIRAGRQEAVTWLRNPDQLHCLKATAAELKPLNFGRTVEDWEGELRGHILNSGSGTACPTEEEWRDRYRQPAGSPLDVTTLAHLVSCERCLDAVNHLVGLPPLAERFPSASSVGNSRRRNRSGHDDDTGHSGGGATGDLGRKLNQYRRSTKEVFEHRPEQLAILVNGLFVVSQKVSAGHGEQVVRLGLDEEIGFIEVLSEQGVRLLMLGVEAPPRGEAVQSKLVRLSDGRTVEAAISHREEQPTLQVVYHDPWHDPTFQNAEGGIRSVESEAPGAGSAAQAAGINEQPEIDNRPAANLKQRFANWLAYSFRPSSPLKPVAVTAILATAIIALLLLTRMTAPAVLATELLRRSQAAEQAVESRTDMVLRRTVGLEERRHPGGQIIARRRLDVWRSAARGLKASRLFDEKGDLVAGEWQQADGSRTLYLPGVRPQRESASSSLLPADLSFTNVWRISLSAADFVALTSGAKTARVEETATTYRISYENEPATKVAGLVKATLVLSKADLHAVEQTLLVRGEDDNPQSQSPNPQLREFRFTETSYERRSPQSVTESVFEPEPELMGSVGATRRLEERAILSPSPRPPVSPSPTAATAELEVEVLALLNQAGADLDDQISVSRSGGRLLVKGLVEDEGRRAEILRALGRAGNQQALQVELETYAEALRRQTQARPAPASTPEKFTLGQSRIAAYQPLHRYFAGRVAAVDEEINRYAARVVRRSGQAMRYLGAMRRVLDQFSPEDVRALSPEARARWLQILQSHARAFARETALIREELRPVFFSDSSETAAEATAIRNDAELRRRIEDLIETAAANNRVITGAFTVSTSEAAMTSLQTAGFWHSLHTAERQAESILAFK